MDTDAIVYFLESILGVGRRTSSDNHSFYCPNCKHNKRKLEINIVNQKWQCWVCGKKDGFRGSNIRQLLKRIGVNEFVYPELKYILPEKPGQVLENNTKKVVLPEEFISLANFETKDIHLGAQARQANQFLEGRGINYSHIVSYNIGFCPNGKYANRIIIPSYNGIGELNYFEARTFVEFARKYDKPPVSRNIIGMEYQINWSAPIILVEGVFDAMTVRRNTIPLLGKTISQELMKKLSTGDVTKIYIALDNDAKKEAVQHCTTLMNMGKEVYFVDMSFGKDFNEIGFEASLKILENTKPLNFSELIKIKMS